MSEKFYKISKSRLCDLLQSEKNSTYWDVREERGEEHCKNEGIERELTNEDLQLELSYYVEISDKETEWDKYIRYLENWCIYHKSNAFMGMSPVCYDEFCDKEEEE